MNPKQILAFALGPICSAGLSLLTVPIIAWYFPMADVGRLAMLQILASFSFMIFGLGLDQAYVREYHESGQQSTLLVLALLPGLLLLTLCLGIGLVVPAYISGILFSVRDKAIGVSVALFVLATFLTRFLSLILRMRERGLAFSMSQILPKGVFLLIIGFYVLARFKPTLFNLVAAQVAATVCVTLGLCWSTKTELTSALSQKPAWSDLQPLFQYGRPLVVSNIAFWVLTAADRIFLKKWSSFEQLGIYSVACSFSAIAFLFQSIFSTIWAPLVYKWNANANADTQKTEQATEWILAISQIIFALAGLFSWVAEWFLPKQYAQVRYLLPICMGYPIFYTLSETTVIGLGLARKTSYAMIAGITAACIALAMNYLLVPRMGAAGAAISTGCGFWTLLVLRTEFSSLTWKKISRRSLYSHTAVSLILSIFFCMMGPNHEVALSFMWSGWLIYLINRYGSTIVRLLNSFWQQMPSRPN